MHDDLVQRPGTTTCRNLYIQLDLRNRIEKKKTAKQVYKCTSVSAEYRRYLNIEYIQWLRRKFKYHTFLESYHSYHSLFGKKQLVVGNSEIQPRRVPHHLASNRRYEHGDR